MSTTSLKTGTYTLFEGSNDVYWGIMEEKEQLAIHLLRLEGDEGSQHAVIIAETKLKTGKTEFRPHKLAVSESGCWGVLSIVEPRFSSGQLYMLMAST